MLEALVVMLNNYFHDLAVAFVFAASLMAHLVLRYWEGKPPPKLVQTLTRVAWGALAWVIVAGAIRSYFFREYEWFPKAGTAQQPVLMVKHVLLVALTIWGLVGVVRLQRGASGEQPS